MANVVHFNTQILNFQKAYQNSLLRYIVTRILQMYIYIFYIIIQHVREFLQLYRPTHFTHMILSRTDWHNKSTQGRFLALSNSQTQKKSYILLCLHNTHQLQHIYIHFYILKILERPFFLNLCNLHFTLSLSILFFCKGWSFVCVQAGFAKKTFRDHHDYAHIQSQGEYIQLTIILQIKKKIYVHRVNDTLNVPTNTFHMDKSLISCLANFTYIFFKKPLCFFFHF